MFFLHRAIILFFAAFGDTAFLLFTFLFLHYLSILPTKPARIQSKSAFGVSNPAINSRAKFYKESVQICTWKKSGFTADYHFAGTGKVILRPFGGTISRIKTGIYGILKTGLRPLFISTYKK